MKVTMHHTCSNRGGEKNVLKNSPFFAKSDKYNKQFLGDGYYFWDNNIEIAECWGEKHYDSKFFIVELNHEITEKNCFDLVGNREHQKLLIELCKQLKENGFIKKENIEIGNAIETLKEIHKTKKVIFNYDMVRSIDYVNFRDMPLEKKTFIDSKNNYTILNPKIIICVFDKKKLNLQNKKIL